MQGTMSAARPGFWQWHAKSVSSEQPSPPRVEVKQVSWKRKKKKHGLVRNETLSRDIERIHHTEHWGILDSWALAMAPAASTTIAVVRRILTMV